MTTAGPNYPSNSSNVSDSGDGAWSSPSNVYADDATYATGFQDGSAAGKTDRLKNLNFGFAIPSGATIDGITVEIDRKTSGGSNSSDLLVQLYKAGALVGSNKASATAYTTSDVTATYGGTSDLWGTTWTDADINDAAFGVCFQSEQTNSVGRTVSVDFVRITVTYSGGSTFVSYPNFFQIL